MPRVPLLSGTRLVVANAGDDDVVLRPPPPGEALADVAAAVREALRFPLEGPPLAELAREARRATIVVEPVTAAGTVLHGGAGALLAASGAETIAAAGGGESLLETAGSDGWQAASALERALAGQVPLVGVSLVLNHPRVSGALQGYPYEAAAVERVVRSP